MKAAGSHVNLEDLQFTVKEIIHKMEKHLGRDLVITSGYRDITHPIEKNKKKPGEHTEGLAVDVYCGTPKEFYDVTSTAIKHGVKRIGISRKGLFIHLGFSKNRPTSVWTY